VIAYASLRESDVGRRVVYEAHAGAGRETGTVVRWAGGLVFVRYDRTGHPAATQPRDLEWEVEPAQDRSAK
jgi:hypothetical protein